MKIWAMGILELGCNCSACGKFIEYGQPAFTLIDMPFHTDSDPQDTEVLKVLCQTCIGVMFPDIDLQD